MIFGYINLGLCDEIAVFFSSFFVKEKIWGHLLKSSPVMIRMSGICLQATRIRFSCDFARFSKNNKTGIETDDFECQEKCQTLQQAIHTIRLQSRPICHGRPKTRVADQILDQTLSFFIWRIFSPSLTAYKFRLHCSTKKDKI